MSAGLLIITHANVGRSMLHQTELLLGPFPGVVRLVGVLPSDDPDVVLGTLNEAMASVDEGDGVLLLTDVFGATPSNIAHRVADTHVHAIVHGLNLAMLMRAHNYAALPLDDLVRKVLEGGRAAIFAGEPE